MQLYNPTRWCQIGTNKNVPRCLALVTLLLFSHILLLPSFNALKQIILLSAHIDYEKTTQNYRFISMGSKFLLWKQFCLFTAYGILNQLYAVITWSFFNSLEGLPTLYWTFVGCRQSALQVKPNHVKCSAVEARSDSSLCFFASLCVMDHCSTEKLIMVQLSANQMGWSVTAECCGLNDANYPS